VSSKTEQPTARKLRRARLLGQWPVSSALTQALAFVAVVALLPTLVAAAAARLGAGLRAALEDPGALPAPSAIAFEVLALTLPLLGAAALTAVAVGLIQGGGVVAWRRLSPDAARLSPLPGLARLLSLESFMSVVRACAAAVLIVWIGFQLLYRHAGEVVAATGGVAAIGVAAGILVQRLLWIAALVGLALAVLDVVVVRVAFMNRHRMSRDEVRREQREAEGDPEVRARRRRAHEELASTLAPDPMLSSRSESSSSER
jgi:flagellar biosynthesis protein FlhB